MKNVQKWSDQTTENNVSIQSSFTSVYGDEKQIFINN